MNAQELELHRISAVQSFRTFLQGRLEQDGIDTLTAPLVMPLASIRAHGGIVRGPMFTNVSVLLPSHGRMFHGTTNETFGLPVPGDNGYEGFLYTDNLKRILTAQSFWALCDGNIMVTIFMDNVSLIPGSFAGESDAPLNLYGSAGGGGTWFSYYSFEAF